VTVFRIGTRASALAAAQAARVAARLGAHELVTIPTPGREGAAGPDGLGADAVSRLRSALLAGEVDAIVHPLQDLPFAPVDGVVLAAVPRRDDARDAFCSRGPRLAELPAGALVGADSPLRRAQLLAARRDLGIVAVEGGVAARLARLAEEGPERLDGVVLAAADLGWLGRSADATELFDLADRPTAPAQGALAVEIRVDGPAEARRRVAALDHRPTRLATAAERGVRERLGPDLAGRLRLPDGLARRLPGGLRGPGGGARRPGRRRAPRRRLGSSGLSGRGAPRPRPSRPDRPTGRSGRLAA